MGITYCRQTNALSDCTRFEGGPNGTVAYFGENVEVSMSNWKERNQTDVWGVEYKTGDKKKHSCGFQLKAIRDNDRVENIHFGLSDYADNRTDLVLDIARVGRDGLRGGITGVESNRPPVSFTREQRDHSVETTIVSYGCSQRKGLLVLEMKKKVNSNVAYMVTLAHYYITKDIGLSVAAKIRRNKDHGFVVEVEGPFSHPSADLRKVLLKTRRTGIWSPGACPHCSNGAEANTDTYTEGSNPTLSDDTINRILKRANLSRNGDQPYTGLINPSEVTNCKSIFILIDFSGAKINSGANSGDRTSYRHSNHSGERTINNSGNFLGYGNAGFVEGGFDASTNNYY